MLTPWKIVAECVSVENRPKYTGGVSGVMGLAFVASPTLGGEFGRLLEP